MDYAKARKNMIDGQLTPNKVTNRTLLKWMNELPREAFVDGPSRDVAYVDSPASVGHGRELYTPLVCARLLQELYVQEGDNLLIVAAATGYSAALASKMGANVSVVEENRNLCDAARRVLADHSCQVSVHHGELLSGEKKNAPYDKILIDAPVDAIPESVISQLSDGGLLGAVVHENGVFTVTVFKKVKNTLFAEHLFETTGCVPESLKQKESFVF